MTGQMDNVGFLATGSRVKQFQLPLGGRFVLECSGTLSESRLKKPTEALRVSGFAGLEYCQAERTRKNP